MTQTKYARDPHHLLRGEISRRWKRRAENEANLFLAEFQNRLRLAA
jgi:hypothetical protein